MLITKLNQRAKQLKIESYSIYLSYRDPRVPWYAKLFIAFVVAYTFSPIDLIPDFIPVLGYLDDLIIIPLGIVIAIKMIPKEVLDEYREKAKETLNQSRPKSWLGAIIIISVWILLAIWIFILLF